MADLAALKRARGGHRGVATRRLKEVKDIFAATDAPDLLKLDILKRGLEETLDNLRRFDNQIAAILDPGDVTKDIEDAEAIKDEIFVAMAQVDNALVAPRVGGTPASTAAVGAPTVAKLPKLQLKHFNGSLTGWSSFWDTYKTAVHLNTSLSKAERFAYLTSLLEGKAKDAITGLLITEANYDVAIDLLEKRFGDKDKAISAHMEELMSLEVVHSEFHVGELRRLYDRTETNIRSLEALGLTVDTYGALLTPIFVKKLPSELRLSFTRKLSSADWNISNIMKLLSEELDARERASLNKPKQHFNSYKHHKPSRDLPTTRTFMGGGETGCCYCKQEDHVPSQCRNISDIEARKRLIKEMGRCFICLRRGHISKDCRSSSKCSNCRGRHHISICGYNSRKVPPSGDGRHSNDSKGSTGADLSSSGRLDPERPPFSPSEPSTTCYARGGEGVLLQLAQCFVFNPNEPHKGVKIFVLFDTGSQCSYVTHELCSRLSLSSLGTKSVSIMTFGSKQEHIQNCNVVKLGVETKTGSNRVLKLLSVGHICEPIVSTPIDLQRYSHFKHLALATETDGGKQIKPDVLIGSDLYWSLLTGEIVKCGKGPVAMDSLLGWILSGPVAVRDSLSFQSTVMTTHVLRVDTVAETKRLDKVLSLFWDLESLGIVENENVVQSQFEEHVSFDKGRYVVSLPWKDSIGVLHDNYSLCLKRLNNLLHRLKGTPDLLRMYDDVIQEQLKLGIVVPVDESEKCGEHRVHYLPHHAVIRSDKSTTKVRVVYDASAKVEGPSLNECLHIGPPLHRKIFDLLLRFRMNPIAITADIEKAFLMIGIAEDDRNVLRFLWFKNVLSKEPRIQAYKFTRVVFGVGPSPYLLNATLNKHLSSFEDSFPTAVQKLKDSMYVDDVIMGADSVSGAISLCQDAKKIFAAGGFNLRKFTSNNKALQHVFQSGFSADNSFLISENDLGVNCTVANLEKHGCITEACVPDLQKVLGMNWNISTDNFVIDLASIWEEASQISPTKRNVIRLVSKIYDPLGLISPVTSTFKILFQELCKCKLPWDEELPEHFRSRWELLIEGFKAEPLNIPRYCLFDSSANLILMGFCDASMKAYAAAVYFVDERGKSMLIASKTKVAPLNTQTIPRLELLGALLLAKLANNVLNALKGRIKQYSCYTDSLVVLHWIKGTDRCWKPFVQNRVKEIRDKTDSNFWYHCAGKNNPADLPSRGISFIELKNSVIWFQGPEWLNHDFVDYTEKEVETMPMACLKELRVKEKNIVMNIIEKCDDGIGNVMLIERFSSFEKLINSTAFVLLFFEKLKFKLKLKKECLCYNELKEQAEILWIKESQNGRVLKEWKVSFMLFCDENKVWRCGGRLGNAELPYNTKYPILLPKGHLFTLLVVRRAHQRVLHSGAKDTLTEIRSSYWIPQGRSFVRNYINHCVICRRYNSSSYKPPPPPPLPEFRVSQSFPFSSVGIDYAGPLWIKQNAFVSQRGRQNTHTTKNVKTWICLFTCCVTRAVHIDLVVDLSSSSFIRCFKRFISRRGLPSRIITDNGSTFKAASKLLKSILDHPEVKDFLSGIRVSWNFNIERAPWWGGFFERMIQLLKRCLRKMIGQARLTFEELLTCVTEVELIVNSRPLTYLSAEDLDEPLTPSHLVGKRLLSLPDYLYYSEEDDFNTDTSRFLLTKRLKHLNVLLEHFWNRWRREYLVELRESHKRNVTESVSDISIGDIVLIHDDTPRGLWKLGLIEKMIIGRDGHTRGAIVRIKGGKGASALYRRPLQRLYPLEVKQKETVDVDATSSKSAHPNTNYVDDSSTNISSRPTRRAAQEARDKIIARLLDS